MAVFSSKDQENAKKAISKLGLGKNKQDNNDNNKPDDNPCLNVSPSQLLVIAGLISGVLEVDSVLVDRDQNIEIVVTGALKRKTQLDMVMEQIGSMPFDRVVKSIMNNAE
jgi:hypothetical protein